MGVVSHTNTRNIFSISDKSPTDQTKEALHSTKVAVYLTQLVLSRAKQNPQILANTANTRQNPQLLDKALECSTQVVQLYLTTALSCYYSYSLNITIRIVSIINGMSIVIISIFDFV